MPKSRTIRFASGQPEESFSGIWRLVTAGDDVYLGASKAVMGIFKISLHKSGIWVLAATEQSGATFQGGNRRAKQWNRPLEHVKGVTRGPVIVVPHTTLGRRPLMAEDIRKKILWYRAPGSGEIVEFSIYFVEPETETPGKSGDTVLAERTLTRGHRVILLASARPSPAERRRARVERTEAIDDAMVGHAEKMVAIIAQLAEEAGGEQYRCSCGLYGPKVPKLTLREATDVAAVMLKMVKQPEAATVVPITIEVVSGGPIIPYRADEG